MIRGWRRAAVHAAAAGAMLAISGAAAAAPAPADNPAAFRLGTAAAPFGWAKRLGDFDRDGSADVAVVDRVDARAGRTVYLLEIDLSTSAAQRFVFSSSQPQLDVAVADVDHDGDLDIIVTPARSRAVAAVWINDGSGRFEERIGGNEQVEAPMSPRAKVAPGTLVDAVPALSDSPRAGPEAWTTPPMLAPPCPRVVALAPLRDRRRHSPSASLSGSRAPPVRPSVL